MFRLLVLVLPLMTAPPDFKHVGGSHGVEVFRQEKSAVIDLYAEGDIEAPPAVVRDVLLDFEHASKLTNNVAESHILNKNNKEIVVYQRLKLPIISDRDFTLRATWEQKGGGTLLTHFAVDNARGPQAKDGHRARLDDAGQLGAESDPRRRGDARALSRADRSRPARCRAGWCRAAPRKTFPSCSTAFVASRRRAFRARRSPAAISISSSA